MSTNWSAEEIELAELLVNLSVAPPGARAVSEEDEDPTTSLHETEEEVEALIPIHEHHITITSEGEDIIEVPPEDAVIIEVDEVIAVDPDRGSQLTEVDFRDTRRGVAVLAAISASAWVVSQALAAKEERKDMTRVLVINYILGVFNTVSQVWSSFLSKKDPIPGLSPSRAAFIAAIITTIVYSIVVLVTFIPALLIKGYKERTAMTVISGILILISMGVAGINQSRLKNFLPLILFSFGSFLLGFVLNTKLYPSISSQRTFTRPG